MTTRGGRRGEAGHGGRREGAGRPPGIESRKRYALDLIERVMRDESRPMGLRLRAAICLAGTRSGVRRPGSANGDRVEARAEGPAITGELP